MAQLSEVSRALSMEMQNGRLGDLPKLTTMRFDDVACVLLVGGKT
jgi:hypothetical protein